MRTTENQMNREDMLELTRRMTLTRNCFGRIAGAYLDAEGYIDGTFNKHFLRLSPKEREANLKIAKEVVFAGTNINMKAHRFSDAAKQPGSIWQMLMALRECELKNDGLLEIFYEVAGETYQASSPYAIYFFYGDYDVPLKASDKENLRESEEVYSFMVCAFCPVTGDYEPGKPEWGFLFPAFTDRSTDTDRICLFQSDKKQGHGEMERLILREDG